MILSSQLPNGLGLHLEPVSGLHSVALGIVVKAGPRYEPPELSGISHFLEHMCFKSTRQRSGPALQKEVDQLGAEWNAYTWWEGSAYYLWIASEHLAAAVDILADMMGPALFPKEIQIEKQVILEEIAMCEDSPDELIIDELFQTAYAGHPLGQRIMGTSETVARLERSALAGYHLQHYGPENLHFIATGSFDPKELTGLVRSKCGRWKPRAFVPRTSRPAFRSLQRTIPHAPLARAHLALALPAPSRRSRFSTVAQILASYLGDEDNGRFFWSIKQKGLADEIWMNYEGFSDTGILYLYASVDETQAPRVLRLIRAELLRAEARIDPAQITRARHRAVTDLLCDAENCLDRFDHLINRLSAGARLLPLEKELESLQSLKPSDIRRYLRAYPLHSAPTCILLTKSGTGRE